LAGNSSGNVGMSASFFDGGKGYGAGFTVGRSAYAFGGFSYLDFDDTTLSLKTVSGGLGYETSPSTSNVTVCPSVGVGYGFGLEILGVDLTLLTITPALSAGMMSEISPTLSVVPFAQAAFVYARASADAGPLGDASDSDTSGLIVLGIGLLFNARIGVGPSVSIPVAEEGGDTVFRVGIAIAVGGQN
jgi:hypothetical protein